jgi:L-lactate dehydrogenase complex protein LldE
VADAKAVSFESVTDRTYPAKPSDVYLFGTCLVDLFDPEAGLSTVALLEREGIRVHFPAKQTCCGQPAYTSGYPDEARKVARIQLALFPNEWPIIVPSGSCAGMMHHHYPVLFADHPLDLPKAKSVAARVFELTEFMVHVCKVRLQDRGKPCKTVLHTSCSGRREMNTHLTSRSLLGQLAGVETVTQTHESECCGFGGAFSVRHPDISSAMASDKVDALLESGAESLVSADCGCLSNLNGTLAKRGARLQGEHIASFLWKRTAGQP